MMPHSRPMPSGVLAAIRRAQGHWIDVTEEVRRQRWWRPQPEELSHEESATFIIGMLWRQTFVWVGSPFCPWLPVIGCITTALCFFAMKHAMLHGAYRAPDQPWASGDTQNIFMLYGMVTLLVNVVPITVWLNQAPACGPHAGFMVTETMTLFEQENLWPHLPEYDVDYHFLGVSMNPAKLFQLSSFLIHYILDSTCLVLVVVYLWSRGELRFIHLMESRAREMISQHQTVCDTRYLKMRLREARKRESDGNQTVMDAGIQEEQQKLHQYIVAMMGASAEDDLKVTGSIALTKESTHPGGTASLDNQVFARVVTRSWALDSAAVQWVESIGADGTRTTKTLEDLGLEGNFSAEVGQNHDSVVWLTVDTSIPNHTKFTLRLNDKVMSNPGMHQHRANKKKGVEVRAAELSFHEVLHFEIPPDLCPKYNGRSDGWMARVTIEAGLLSQKDKLGHLLRPNALKRAPKYSFKLELFNTSEDVTHPCSMSKMSGNGTGLLVVPERPDAIASGLAALNRPTATELVAVDEVLSTRPFWQVYVDYWRESHDRTDETGMPINSAVVIEYMVEVRQVRFIVDANGHGKPTIDDSLHAEARRQRHKLHGRKIKPKVEVLKVFAQEWRTFPHFTNMHAAIRTCLAIDKQEALPKLPPKYHKSHFTLGNENLRTKKFYDDRRYRLELYMNEMLNTPEVGARANPYFLGLCGTRMLLTLQLSWLRCLVGFKWPALPSYRYARQVRQRLRSLDRQAAGGRHQRDTRTRRPAQSWQHTPQQDAPSQEGRSGDQRARRALSKARGAGAARNLVDDGRRCQGSRGDASRGQGKGDEFNQFNEPKVAEPTRAGCLSRSESLAWPLASRYGRRVESHVCEMCGDAHLWWRRGPEIVITNSH
eukprot:47236_4